MSIFACLICEKGFKIITRKDLLESDRDDSIVVTKCGHLYHRTCLDCAFVLQKVQLQVENRPERRHCPYKSCQQDVTGFPIVQVNPIEIKRAEDESELRQLKLKIAKLTSANEELMKEVQKLERKGNDDNFQKGEKVYWKEKEGKYTPATVLELQAKIKIVNESGENASKIPTTVSALRSKFYNLSFMQEQTVPLTDLLSEKTYLNYESLYTTTTTTTTTTSKPDPRPESTMSTDSGISASGGQTPIHESTPPWNPPPSAGVGQQPRWMAGDRVYFPKEQHHATIKWIGYSETQYKFIVCIEYDEPVGDNSLENMDIPVRYKLGHGRKLDYEELNRLGVKEDNNSNMFRIGKFMFGSGRKKAPPNRSRSFQQNSNEIENAEKFIQGNRSQPQRSLSSPGTTRSNRFQ